MYSIQDASNFTINQVWELYRKHVNPSQVELIGTFPFGRELVEYSEGCWIHLKSGEHVLDLTGGIGVLNHGHNHPRILKARKDFASSKKMEVYKSYFSPYIAALGANVAEMLPEELKYSYFPNSGAEAVEGALKIAYKYHNGKRKYVLHADISFHGKLLGAAGITGSPEVHFKFPTIPNSVPFEHNNIDSIKKLVADLRVDNSPDIYAIVIEPLSASTMRSLSTEFLIELREICTSEDIVLIFDEVYTGWGKTGTLFNFMRVPGLVPDILTYAKSFGGGKASISGYSYTSKIANAFNSLKDATLHSTTYYGFGEEVATAIEALNIINEENLVQKSFEIGEYFYSLFEPTFTKNKNISDFRGSGALWGILLEDKIMEQVVNSLAKLSLGKIELLGDPRIAKKILNSAIVSELYEKHKVLTYFGVNRENPLIISFPLIATKSEVEIAAKSLQEVLDQNIVKLVLKFVTLKMSGPKSKL